MNYNYRQRRIGKKIKKNSNEFLKVFSDHEIKLLLLWALIGPFCALAYIVWKKYPNMKIVSLLFVILNFNFHDGLKKSG